MRSCTFLFIVVVLFLFLYHFNDNYICVEASTVVFDSTVCPGRTLASITSNGQCYASPISAGLGGRLDVDSITFSVNGPNMGNASVGIGIWSDNEYPKTPLRSGVVTIDTAATSVSLQFSPISVSQTFWFVICSASPAAGYESPYKTTGSSCYQSSPGIHIDGFNGYTLVYSSDSGTTWSSASDNDYLVFSFTVAPSPSPSGSVSPSLSKSPSISDSPSITPSSSDSASVSPSPSYSVSVSPSLSSTLSPSLSISPSISISPSNSESASLSPSLAITLTASLSSSASPSPLMAPAACRISSLQCTSTATIVFSNYAAQQFRPQYSGLINTIQFSIRTSGPVASESLFEIATVGTGSGPESRTTIYQSAAQVTGEGTISLTWTLPSNIEDGVYVNNGGAYWIIFSAANNIDWLMTSTRNAGNNCPGNGISSGIYTSHTARNGTWTLINNMVGLFQVRVGLGCPSA